MPTTALEIEVQREKSLKLRVKWILASFVALLVLVAAAGASYQAICEHHDRDRFPEIGRRVDAGGFSLNLNCTGKGNPTVVLESGLGIPAIGWELVQPKIAEFARVCSYDRAGYGWSDPGLVPRTSREIARELHTLLKNARVPPPYILVGHSFGGFNIRLFNQMYPREVAGAIFVDASQEDEESEMSEAMKEASAKSLRQLRRMDSVMGFLKDFGIARVGIERNLIRLNIPRQLRDELAYLELQKKYIDAILSEKESFDASAEEARDAGTFGDKPLIVLTAGAQDADPGVPQKDADEFFESWVGKLQPQLAQLSTNGSQLVLLNSDHLIPFEQPQAVADAVRQVITDSAEQRGANDRHRI